MAGLFCWRVESRKRSIVLELHTRYEKWMDMLLHSLYMAFGYDDYDQDTRRSRRFRQEQGLQGGRA